MALKNKFFLCWAGFYVLTALAINYLGMLLIKEGNLTVSILCMILSTLTLLLVFQILKLPNVLKENFIK